MNYTPTVATRFRMNMKVAKLNQRMTLPELSEKSGVSERQLSYIMGGSDTTLTNADKIANALGYTLTGLIQYRAKHD